ncbi:MULTISPECIES: hypothetical protein [unclassified Streptomyces]
MVLPLRVWRLPQRWETFPAVEAGVVHKHRGTGVELLGEPQVLNR